MGWTNDQEKALRDRGYRQSTADPNKMINDNGHWAKTSSGGSVTVKTSYHRTYGNGVSGQSLNDSL